MITQIFNPDTIEGAHMKKILATTSALVAFGLVGSGQASASEKIKLQLGGHSKWWIVGKWNDSKYQNALGGGQGTSYNNVDVIGDNEIHFVGSTTLDNGLKVGIQVELEAGGHTDMTSDTIDRSFVFVQGGFGKVILGSEANSAEMLHIMAPDAAGNTGQDGLLTAGFAIATPSNVYTAVSTELTAGGNADKITYVSPNFHGLTIGVSYVPNYTEDSRAPSDASEYYTAAFNYSQEFSGVGIKVSGGYMWDDIGTQYDMNQEWSLGTQISYAGFTLGGSFRKINNNFSTTMSNSSVSAVPSLDNSGRNWDAGIQYASGPWAASFVYFSSKSRGIVNTAGDDSFTVYQASGKYTLGPGVDVLGTIGHADYKDETTIVTNNHKGWAAMTGLSLTF